MHALPSFLYFWQTASTASLWATIWRLVSSVNTSWRDGWM